jgi:hypothetical protein
MSDRRCPGASASSGVRRARLAQMHSMIVVSREAGQLKVICREILVTKLISEVGALTLALTHRQCGAQGDRHRGLKVIADRFENLFSIYRRDFLKMIADHFSSAVGCEFCDRHWQINLGTIQMLDSLRVQFETSDFQCRTWSTRNRLLGQSGRRLATFTVARLDYGWTTVNAGHNVSHRKINLRDSLGTF